MAGIYIHIPFCQKKCPYCDFYSVVNAREMAGFVKALKVEIPKRAYELDGEVVGTIYFGGGTPSMLSHQQIGEILAELRGYFDIDEGAEITMECNPGDVSKMDITHLVAYGVNRFSIGAQTFQNDLLKTLGRRHKMEETLELVETMRKVGVGNISLDLIYSIPGESLKQQEADLRQLIALQPEHISAYDLIYESGTPLYDMRERGEIMEVPEELSLEMAHMVRDMLKGAGYEQYEISNFAKKGFRSRHNSNYWRGVPYIGLGPSAHSFVPPWRSWNEPSLTQYADQLLNGAAFLDRPHERISAEKAYEEYLLTRLRTIEGISTNEMKAMGFGVPERAIEELVERGLLKGERGSYHLTDGGLDLANRVLLTLISE